MQIGLALAVAVLACMVYFAYHAISAFNTTTEWVLHSQRVRIQIEEPLSVMKDVESAGRGFVITGNELYLEAFETGIVAVGLQIRELRKATADNPFHQARITDLEPVIERKLFEMRRAITARQTGGFEAVTALLGTSRGRQLMEEIRSLVGEMRAEEAELLDHRLADARAKARQAGTVLVGGLVLDFILVFAMGLFMRQEWQSREAAAESAAEAAHSSRLAADASQRAADTAKQALSYAESIIDTVREPLVILTHDLKINSANRAFYEYFQTAPNDLVGREFQALAEGQFAIPTLVQALLEVVPAHTHVEGFEITVNVPKLGPRMLALNARKLRRPGNNTTMMLVAIDDVTARNRLAQVHQHFRALFESLPGLYLVLQPDFMIVAASDAYLHATMTRRSDLVGRNLFDAFPQNPEETATHGESDLRASLQRVLQNKTPDTMPITKYDIRNPDGTFTERFWSPVNSAVLGPDGQVEYLIHRVEDVTDFVRQKAGIATNSEAHGVQARIDRMEAEIYSRSQETEAALRRLRLANEELEAFSYSVSHDLRAPLRHIGGFASLLERHLEPSLDEKARRYLKTIADSSTRMGMLIDDLLAFSRIGRTEMRRVDVDLGALVGDVRQSLVPEINGRTVEWEIQPLPHVSADPALMRQVFANLLGNAVKYSRQKPEARITVGSLPSDPGTVTLFVRDNGAGFEMQYAAKLFGVFQRLHTDNEFEGTGVGLANVRQIITKHGGRVWAEGKVGEGATFYFTLPLNGTPAKNEG